MTHSLVWALLIICGLCLGGTQGAAIQCGPQDAAISGASKSNEMDQLSPTSTPKPSEVNQFLHNVQCTLEKAKPWIEDIEKEAKRLEETAKRVGLRIVHRFGDLMDTLLGVAVQRKPPVPEESTSSTVESQPEVYSSSMTTDSVKVELGSSTTESPLMGVNDADNEIIS